MSKNNIGREVECFRAETGKGLRKGTGGVDREGGRNGEGLISGFAVITKGEALGHGFWVDDEFAGSVGTAISSEPNGSKSRYTHPGMSSDGLSKHLGRAIGSTFKNGVTYSDLHIAKSAHNSPDGDLAEHVMARADEDPGSFGASISFMHDRDAEDVFEGENQEEYEYQDYRGETRKGTRFKSPDPLNTKNLPHVRLKELLAVDIVGDPAANPNGMFCYDDTYREVEGLFSYAIGQSSEKPELCSLGINPDRARTFITKYLNAKGYEIMSKNDSVKPVEASKEVVKEELSTEPGSTPKPEVSVVPEPLEATGDNTPLLAEDGKKFVTAFGDKGARWFLEGKTFEDSLLTAYQQRGEEIEMLNKKIKHLESSEPAPLSSNDGTGQRESRGGFASKIRLAGLTPSQN